MKLISSTHYFCWITCTIPGECACMYLCVRGIDFISVYLIFLY